MLAILAEAALRSFVLGSVVWLGLTILRVRNPYVQMTAWIMVLIASLSMPLAMDWATVTITVPASPLAVQTFPPADNPLDAFGPTLLPEPASSGAAHDAIDRAIDWWTVATVAYALIAGLLLLRLGIGLYLTWRLARNAARIRKSWTGSSDVRVSAEIGGPVTFGSVILLPPEFKSWDQQKRQAVLAHERAHIAGRDFHLLLLASLNRALFWFSPFAWWQLRRLAELAEVIADARAIEVLEDRASYAEFLLELVQNVRQKSLGLEMARACTVPGRVDRILAAVGLPAKLDWRKRIRIAAAIIPVVIVSSGTIAYRTDRSALLSVDPPGLLPALHKVERADFYAFGARSVFAVFREGDELLGQVTGQRKLPLTVGSDGSYSYAAAAGPISFSGDLDRASELALNQNGRVLPAKRIAAMHRGGESNPTLLDQYAGWYQLAPDRALAVRREGYRMLIRQSGGFNVAVTADAADAFSSDDGNLILFLRNEQGEVTQVLLSDPIVGARLAPRIDAAKARTIDEGFARRLTEVPDRFRQQTPLPGSKEAILQGIADMQRGTPNYDRMSASLADKIRRQADQLHAMFVAMGAVESIFFRGVGPGGYDIYGVKFANGSAEFRIELGPDGKAEDVLFRPDGNGEPGGIYACSTEPSLKPRGDTSPIRIMIYNDSGEDLQLFKVEADGRHTAQGTVADGMTWATVTTVGNPWLVSDRSGQCREIVVPGRRTRFHTVFSIADASRADSAMDRAEARRTAPQATSEETLRQYIEALGRGRPDYEHMSADVAALTRQQLPFDQAILGKLGALKALSFRGVTALDTDIYVAHFANGSAEWRIGVGKDGTTITRLALGPQY